MLTILEKDRQFASELPKYTVVSASAGSGKTRALKQRVVQLLLARSIPNKPARASTMLLYQSHFLRVRAEMAQTAMDI